MYNPTELGRHFVNYIDVTVECGAAPGQLGLHDGRPAPLPGHQWERGLHQRRGVAAAGVGGV